MLALVASECKRDEADAGVKVVHPAVVAAVGTVDGTILVAAEKSVACVEDVQTLALSLGPVWSCPLSRRISRA